MPNIVSFKIQIEGSNEIKTITFSADELGKALDAVRTSTKSLKGELVNLGSISQVLEGVSGALNTLNGLMTGLTAAYTEQVEAETLLATAMRNTMDATDEEIQRIKDLTAEQQKLGIVGDEVQLAAAQELATYLSLSSSLETIIPTMNDMIAQQIRMGASAESATQIATMLGKVMNGQTKALSRYGYEFSEAQEYILKFGDESERAAVLVDVVGQSVGGANKNTREAVGAYQNMVNALGDVREKLGQITYKAQPAITALAQVGQAVTGIIQLKNAIKALSDVELIAAANAKVQAAAQKLLEMAGYSAAAGTTALKLATIALYGALTMGLSVAVTGLITLFQKLGRKGKEAAEGVDDVRQAQEAYTNASMDVRLQMAEEIVKLDALIKSKQDDSKAVADLNSRYGEIFGSHKTATEWYDILTQKSQVYAKQLGYEAQAKVIASQKAAKELEKQGLEKQRQELAERLDPNSGKYDFYGVGMAVTHRKGQAQKELAALDQQIQVLDADTTKLGADFDSCMKNMAAAAEELGTFNSGGGGNKPNGKTPAEQLKEDVDSYRASVERAVQVNQTFGGSAQDADVRLKAMQSGITSLINKYGAEEEAIKDLIKEYGQLMRARGQALPALATISTPSSVKSAQISAPAPTISARPGHQPTEYDLAFRKYNEIKAQIPGTDPSQLKILQQQLETLRELYDIPEEKADSLNSSIDAFGALADAMGSLSSVVDDGAASWLKWGANVLKAIGQALPALATLFAANTAVAGSEGAASVASVPYVGPILAVAAVASIAAAIASLPKFAEGGLVYGPTIGLFGEYANARTNPEFVAPASDIKKYLSDSGGFGEVEFRISGYDLIGLARKVNRQSFRNNG